ncbi:MAG: hypothetical protein M3Q42_03620 [Pseudomonadota bacterium]|nr:hypothetical protein [Pseudomonadota bacterium]
MSAIRWVGMHDGLFACTRWRGAAKIVIESLLLQFRSTCLQGRLTASDAQKKEGFVSVDNKQAVWLDAIGGTHRMSSTRMLRGQSHSLRQGEPRRYGNIVVRHVRGFAAPS